MSGYLDLFDRMLTDREYLLGEFSAADVAAFPFVRFTTIPHKDSSHLFHRILRDCQKSGAGLKNLARWIDRVNRHPRV